MNFDVKNYLFLLLVSFIFTKSTNGLKVRKNRDKNVDFLKNLSNFLKKFKAESSVIGDRGLEKIRSSVPKEYYKRERKGDHNAVLVKRLVPSNYESKGYEYDKLFETLYRPLVRLDRKNKKVKFIDQERLNELLKQTDGYAIVERPNRDLTPEDDYLLQPFEADFRHREEEKILNEIKNYARSHGPKQVSQLKDSILRTILDKKLRDKKYLVTHIDVAGKKTQSSHLIKSVIEPEHKLLEGQPEYGYWHYWTYEREILQDHCKGKAVQYGNICIQTPPH